MKNARQVCSCTSIGELSFKGLDGTLTTGKVFVSHCHSRFNYHCWYGGLSCSVKRFCPMASALCYFSPCLAFLMLMNMVSMHFLVPFPSMRAQDHKMSIAKWHFGEGSLEYVGVMYCFPKEGFGAICVVNSFVGGIQSV